MDRLSLFIDGEQVAPLDGTTRDVVEAATGDVIGTAALGGVSDIDRAVTAAARAKKGWAATPAKERADLIDRMAGALFEAGKETAALVSRENGMPIRLSIGANKFAPAAIFQYYAGLVRGDVENDERNGQLARTLVRRDPIGVVAAITPWNYPQALAAMKLGPALAAGCTVVLKPAPETALDAHAFADAAAAAGLPPGVLNVVPADREAGAALVSHAEVNKVAFTGSTAAGRAIGAECGRLLRPVTLELGGKSASIVCEDADLELFAKALLEISLPNNGQTCHACTRILAPAGRYAEVVEAVTETVRSLRIGNPLEKDTQIGPLVSPAQRDRVLDYVNIGRTDGGRVTVGGEVPADLPGWYVQPTVFADVDNNARIAQEEIFGPVLAVIPYRDEDEAVALANDSEYGLGGTVWTGDVERGIAIADRIETGTVGVNHYALDFGAPFGGVKASGLGRELGPEGLAPYVQTRSVYLAPVAR
ncbi:aldehyde dehydrogenase [Sporichthya brevicatena]|uniref:Aldehyde dehydrogenase n=1 Tax=Sporichthya brevicatena TaxID=171442 RepID=A0ABN1H6H0_9ACTN